MMSRGCGRRASSLVPGNGGAPAPVLARRPAHGGPAGTARRARRHACAHSFDAAHLQPDLQVSRVRAHRNVAPIPTSVFAPRYWRWLASAWPGENRYGRLRRPGPPTERRRDLICTAMPQRQNPLDSQGARTPMNAQPRTDLIQLITRTESLSGDAALITIRGYDDRPISA
jgi:hypothetical protein